MSLIFVFVDGMGLGKNNGNNPLFSNYYASFLKMTGGRPLTDEVKTHYKNGSFFSPVDACLGVEGLPQSGTGQVTLFSGVNTAKKLGRHFGPYPHSAIRKYLGASSLFQKLKRENGRSCFINAFPEVFFEHSRERNRWSSTTLMTLKAGLPLNTINEVLEEKAVTAEINQKVWKERLSQDVPEITEKHAADRVIAAAEDYDLVLMEYYLTDKAGHERDMDQAQEILQQLDRFLMPLIEKTEEKRHTLLLTSDHGNIEDLSTKTHTRNKVPFFVTGNGSEHFHGIRSIREVTPLCVTWYRSILGQCG